VVININGGMYMDDRKYPRKEMHLAKKDDDDDDRKERRA
jgi:hypothetical protein